MATETGQDLELSTGEEFRFIVLAGLSPFVIAKRVFMDHQKLSRAFALTFDRVEYAQYLREQAAQKQQSLDNPGY